MERDLEKYLILLNSERHLKQPKVAVSILEKITKCFTPESSQFTLGSLTSLLLDADGAFFAFVWRMSAQYETLGCVLAAFRLLHHLVTDFRKSTEPYFPVLYEKCIHLLDVKFAKVRELSLSLIRLVIEGKLGLDLSKVVNKLEKCITQESKIAGTVVEEMYCLFGYLFEKHPETLQKKKWLLVKMLETLRQETTVAKTPTLGCVRGAFEGINGYMTHHPPPEGEAMKKMYEYIKKWCKYQLNRRMVGRAGLNLLHNHWRHFSSHIYADKEFWKINLEVWINQKGADRQVAFQFLCSFYSVIAFYSTQERNNEEVMSYMAEFGKSLGSNCNSYEKKAALVGIKLFVLTCQLDDYNETYEVVTNFIKREERGKGVIYAAHLVECVSAFVLRHPEESFRAEQSGFLQRLSVRLIENYPKFEGELQTNALVSLEKSFYMMGLQGLQAADDHIDTVIHQGLIRTCSAMTRADLELLLETGDPPETVCCKSYLGLWQYLLSLANSPNLPVGGSFPVKKRVASRVFDAFVGSFLKIISKLNYSADSDADLNIFTNAVDLYEDLIGSIDAGGLEKWLGEIFRTVIRLSQGNPLVCGLYRLTAVSLKAADGVDFLDAPTKCLDSVRTYLENILSKVGHYKGELQVACLNVLLSAPAKVVAPFAEETIPALEVITQLSRGCFPMLKDLIDTLERWNMHLPPDTSCLILKRILPLLDIFFRSPHFRSSISGKDPSDELHALQKKFLMFLGNLEVGKSLNLIELPETEDRRGITDRHLIYQLPCGRGTIELNLDEMVLRVIDLAESCADRRTRLTACELLHAFLLIIVGNVSQTTGGYTYLFRRAVRCCLLLGCDSDGLVRQIFEPVMYQLVRYFSSARFPETDDLVEILMNFVTCPWNPNARDFSGELLREFTDWSLQKMSSEAKTTPEIIGKILDRIYTLALHPCYGKRLGAAVAFNRIYSVLREENSILNAHWFQLFYHFVESLRMCEETDDVEEMVQAIRHVERPLVEMRREFNKDSPERVVPPEFQGGRLCHLVRWTMERACDVKPAARRMAMQLVETLAPLVENCDSNMSFSSKQLQNFLQVNHTSESWLSCQTAGFEYCAWLLQENILKTEEVFQPEFKDVLKNFAKCVTSQKSKNEDTDERKQQSVLAFLSLLYALRERTCLYPSEYWMLLKTALFKPSRLGFDPDRSERLLSILIDLFRHFTANLHDWSHFDDLHTVMVAPVFGRIVRKKTLTMSASEFLFALKVLEGSGSWKIFQEKVFLLDEDLFLVPIFKALFFRRGREILAVAPDPSCQLYLEELLRVMLNTSSCLNGLMKCLENEEKVREEETMKTVRKGEFFESLFQNAILRFLENRQNQLLDWVLKQKTARGLNVLMRVLENLTDDSDLPLEVFLRWDDFEEVELGPEKDRLLLRLAVSGARVVGTPGFLKTSTVAAKICAVLGRLETLDLSEVQAVVALLPYLSVFAEAPDENDRLRDALSVIPKSGKVSSKMEVVLAGVLQSLEKTASLVLLDFALSRASLFGRDDVESALKVFAEDRSPVAHSMAALELVYSHTFERENVSSVYKSFLGPLMRIVPNDSLYEFVEKRVEALSRLMSTYWGEDKTPAEILADMARKMSAAGVFQTVMTRLTREELEQMPKNRRQMIDGTVKNVFFFLKKPYPPRVLKERYRRLMCEIFNMICCIVSARCVDEKFYKLFIFDDRGSFLFEAIDKTAGCHLGMDFEEIPKRRKHLTILRETVAPAQPPKYIQTNTLMTSSFREEVTRFDLTSAFIRPVDSVRNAEIELEMDTINSHECMATLVATIAKMVHDGITPVDEFPTWLRFFLNILRNSDLNDNLRLFAFKVIYNVQEFVTPYCATVFPVLVDAALKLFANHPMNYFLMDLIEMMLSWKHVPEEERVRLHLTDLVVVVLEKSDSLRRDIVKHNLDILKLMVEVWKPALNQPELSSVVFRRLSGSDPKTDGVYLNIHACGILLSNGIPPWPDGEEGRFFELILRNFRDENRLNQEFGEVCGQALEHIRLTKPERVGQYEQSVRGKIECLSGCWLLVLHGIHRHYPRISSLFAFRIFSSAWDSMDTLTVKKLEMLLTVGEDATFERYLSGFLLDMLNSPDAEVVEVSLRIAETHLDKLDGERLKLVVREVASLQRNPHPGVRKWVYEIGKKLYGKGPDGVGFATGKLILLRGLNDTQKELEDSCLAFWTDGLDVTSPDTALPLILDEMYAPDTEDVFLSNVARVVLQKGDEGILRREVFQNPIAHRCKFQKRNLIMGTRASFMVSLSRTTMVNQSLENVATVRRRNYVKSKFEPTVVATLPKNPEKRRFWKSEVRRPNTAAKPEGTKPEGRKPEGTKPDVDIYGEYKDGDYPDVQIRHEEVVKLLEVLCKQDRHTARLFLVSFFSGLVKSLGISGKANLLTKSRDAFLKMLTTSGSFEPGVFGFVLRVVLDHGLDLDCELVSNAAVSSNWIALGALIIEREIVRKEDESAFQAKMRRGEEKPWEKRWLKLAKLYRILEEVDVVSGIFLEKLTVCDDAKEAFRCEATRDWAGASVHYEKALRTTSEVGQTEFYTESYLTCLAKMSNWSGVNSCIRTTVSDDLGELWNNYFLLSWFLKSEMMLSLGTDRTEFRTSVEEFCKNTAKRNLLSANFGEEMTVFDWTTGNLQRANHRIDKLCLDFLSGWCHLDRWAYKQRAAKLLCLQTISELSVAVGNIEGKRWSVPAHEDDLMVWDVKLSYRREFLTRNNNPVMDVRANLALAKAALAQNNLSLTKECLCRAKAKLPESDFELKTDHDICFNSGKMAVAKAKMKDPEVGLNVYLNVWTGISNQVAAAMETDSDSGRMFVYSCNFSLGKLVSEVLPYVDDGMAPPQVVANLSERLKVSEGKVRAALRDTGSNYFESAIAALEAGNSPSETISNAYLELARFRLKFCPDFGKLGCVLRAMTLGNPDGRDLFGRLLNLRLLVEAVPNDILAEADRVPTWMYLQWIDQMLSRLTTTLFPFLKSILVRITEEYPNAIRYPLRLTQEKQLTPELAEFVSGLLATVSKERIYEDFLSAVEYLAPPDRILQYYLERLLQRAKKQKKPPGLPSRLKELMFSPDYAKFRGPVFKVWDAFKDRVGRIDDSNWDRNLICEVLSSIQTMKMPSKRALGLLESYSPWLHRFHALRTDGTLELPGQYGRGRPIKKHLVTISSFKNAVMLFDSKCRPMRVTVLGNDAKEHKFLVKLGDDLQQDMKIQQVFEYFNQRLETRHRIETYTVVPFSKCLGLIQWVEDAVSLLEMVENALGDNQEIANAQNAHLAFLSQGASLGPVDAHLAGYESVKREAAISNFRATARRFPPDLLKRSLVDLSTSPEHFVHLRGNFATSHAVASLTHWLVGIGDRHLQNTLVSTRTGRVVGIDFGYAFGSATRVLTPPELVPFRLTPQILGVTSPLGESGLIKQTMIHCLRVFRRDRFALESVLQVFAMEPRMRWVKRRDLDPNSTKLSQHLPARPKENSDMIEGKLDGENPVFTFTKDLLAGHSRAKHQGNYKEVLKGIERENFRARCAMDGLTEEEQVECLIDLATDDHVLAKTYVGWNPWL